MLRVDTSLPLKKRSYVRDQPNKQLGTLAKKMCLVDGRMVEVATKPSETATITKQPSQNILPSEQDISTRKTTTVKNYALTADKPGISSQEATEDKPLDLSLSKIPCLGNVNGQTVEVATKLSTTVNLPASPALSLNELDKSNNWIDIKNKINSPTHNVHMQPQDDGFIVKLSHDDSTQTIDTRSGKSQWDEDTRAKLNDCLSAIDAPTPQIKMPALVLASTLKSGNNTDCEASSSSTNKVNPSNSKMIKHEWHNSRRKWHIIEKGAQSTSGSFNINVAGNPQNHITDKATISSKMKHIKCSEEGCDRTFPPRQMTLHTDWHILQELLQSKSINLELTEVYGFDGGYTTSSYRYNGNYCNGSFFCNACQLLYKKKASEYHHGESSTHLRYGHRGNTNQFTEVHDRQCSIEYCDREYPREQMKKHLAYHNYISNGIKSGSGCYPCRTCQLFYKHPASLNSHMDSKTHQDNVRKSQICS